MNKKFNKHEFYLSTEWRALRYRVLLHYGRKCMACNDSSSRLHVDHIKPISLYPDLRLDFNNLQVLCESCNIGKSNNDETDFRPKELINSEKPKEIKIIKLPTISQNKRFAIRKGKQHILIGSNTVCLLFNSKMSKLEKFKIYDNPTKDPFCLTCLAKSKN